MGPARSNASRKRESDCWTGGDPWLPPRVHLRGGRVSSPEADAYVGRVEAGLVAVIQQDSRGREAIVDVRGVGSTLGESRFVGLQSAAGQVSLEALVPTRVRWIDPAPIATDPAPELIKAVMSVLAARTRRQQQRACHRRTHSTSQHVAHELVGLWPETSLGSEGSALEHLSRTDLARIVGSNRSPVSTICAEFTRRGWCHRLGKPGMRIDLAALSAYAGYGPSATECSRANLNDYEDALWTLVDTIPVTRVDVA